MSELPKSQNFDEKWPRYYQAVAGRVPRNTLLAALERFDNEEPDRKGRFAVDLGCGEGRDTVELLRRGWRVLAIDGNAEAFERMLARPDLQNVELLETKLGKFQDTTWPETDLINGSFCLPFCPPEYFSQLWDKIVQSIRVGGRFSGQLFGDRDDWAKIPTHSHFTQAQVEKFLEPFEIEVFNIEEEDGKTALQEPKHWHIFHIVARKK
ncbi:class I SAM-dependent methyltransferase [Aerosakkonema funiforme]|uniref:Class I SAM-dependent methyltransferase n=2 Tax=Oscillatoriophycideae TaxID=1301283 RepID=A0A926VDC7_9CYAN|nr:class I SAM-dependent methyltransferase [Aerosakkonema funiforme]MBD2180464.1 class I SAM-dependent methyltransferase [Aerosakkonema funiforme FACHB-1375]